MPLVPIVWDCITNRNIYSAADMQQADDMIMLKVSCLKPYCYN